MENEINEEFEEIEEKAENVDIEELDDEKNSDNSTDIYYEDSSEIKNKMLISDDSSNTIIENQTLVLEKLDNHTTCLNAIFFLICLWFVIDVIRNMINTK